jgi:hypothetical protein
MWHKGPKTIIDFQASIKLKQMLGTTETDVTRYQRSFNDDGKAARYDQGRWIFGSGWLEIRFRTTITPNCNQARCSCWLSVPRARV